mmetsp:Transcript_2608/g.7800  ORF Transcript_2608/g.7800 Transcript_2608/m.7800 type:complete len:219 (+) Transcript_2608:761-1417(+)
MRARRERSTSSLHAASTSLLACTIAKTSPGTSRIGSRCTSWSRAGLRSCASSGTSCPQVARPCWTRSAACMTSRRWRGCDSTHRTPWASRLSWSLPLVLEFSPETPLGSATLCDDFRHRLSRKSWSRSGYEASSWLSFRCRFFPSTRTTAISAEPSGMDGTRTPAAHQSCLQTRTCTPSPWKPRRQALLWASSTRPIRTASLGSIGRTWGQERRRSWL